MGKLTDLRILVPHVSDILPKMKLRYRNVRVGLMTFAVGLAAVWISTGLEIASRNVAVHVPAASEDVIYVFPSPEGWQVGGHWQGDFTCPVEQPYHVSARRVKKHR